MFPDAIHILQLLLGECKDDKCQYFIQLDLISYYRKKKSKLQSLSICNTIAALSSMVNHSTAVPHKQLSVQAPKAEAE